MYGFEHLEDLMRKINASLFVSLDGVAEAPETWHFPYFNDEMGSAVVAAMADSEAMLLGRVQYQQFAAYWPTSEDEAADLMNNQKKYVVTNTLTEAT
jgi:dihydrofolate reductase